LDDNSQLMRGTLHALVLRILEKEQLHGYAIAKRLEELSGGVLGVEDGALYQALHRMQARGWLQSDWGHAETGKRARFYAITAAGRRQLARETQSWVRYAEAVFHVLGAAGKTRERGA
jgi:PadR family transcriptional regulator, regulatory protein PadR